MTKPRLWSRKSFKPLKTDGKRDKAERFVVTRGIQVRRLRDTGNVYQNTDGEIAYDYFSGKHLVTMHRYRDAYEHALYTGDATGLRKFKHKIIITYDGPGLRNYHNKGVLIYPETNLKKLLAKRASMTTNERLRFDNDRYYRHLEIAA